MEKLSRDKQIEEMARTMCLIEHCPVKSCIEVNCEKTWLAEALYNAGYRKASDVTKEIFEELKKLGVVTKVCYGGKIIYDCTDGFAELKKKYESEGEG